MGFFWFFWIVEVEREGAAQCVLSQSCEEDLILEKRQRVRWEWMNL